MSKDLEDKRDSLWQAYVAQKEQIKDKEQGEDKESSSCAMSKELKGKRASLWHAYIALKEQGKDKESAVAKGQLKVLTQNLATRVGLTDIENQLQEQFASVDTIQFDDYTDFLAGALFDRLVSDNAGSVPWDKLEGLDEVCWFICAKTYCGGQERLLNAQDVYKLWRIFNAVAETSDDVEHDEAAVPVTVHSDEMELVVQRLGVILRTPITFDAGDQAAFSFGEFLRTIETNCLAGKNTRVMASAVGEMYDDVIVNVLKKGYLYRRGGYGVTMNNERVWFVLTPTLLQIYSGRDEKDKKSQIVISKACQVVDLPDKAGLALGGIGIGIGRVKTNRFTVRFSDGSSKPIELYAEDVHTKSEWLQAFRTATEWRGSVMSSPHGVELKKRRTARAQRRARERDEMRKKRDEEEKMERTLKELEEQRQAREDAERRCREDQQRIAELQELHGQMEGLLELERQAKRDEETVRSLQAKVLQEEFEKREQLEELKASLEQLLQQEQMKSSELEELRRQQEKILAEEQLRLETLEQERQMRDQQYETAVAKLSEAERAKEEMEQQMKQKELELQKRPGARFQRSRPAGDGDVIQLGVSHRGPGAFPLADMTWRRKAEGTWTSPTNSSCSPPSVSDQQVPIKDDAVASDSSTVPVTVESTCPSATQEIETTENPPSDVNCEVRQPADDGQPGEQTQDDNKRDETEQLQPPASAESDNEHLLTASQ